MAFTAILDANVLYPMMLRDFLITLATTGLYRAKWTEQIHDEWVRNLLNDRRELEVRIQTTSSLMNEAVPDCLVVGYEALI